MNYSVADRLRKTTAQHRSKRQTKSVTMVGEDWRTDGSRAAGAPRQGSGRLRRSTLVSRTRSHEELRRFTPARPRRDRNDRRESALKKALATLLSLRAPFQKALRLPLRLFRHFSRQLPRAATRSVLNGKVFARVSPTRVRFGRFRPADLPLVVAVPGALLLIYLLTSGPLPLLDHYSRVLGVALEPTDVIELSLAAERAPRPVQPGVSTDAAQFEQIQRLEYTVQVGDTISEIAYAHGLSSGTLMSLNPGHDVRRLLPGTVLSIPNRDGILYSIGPGDSLSSISTAYEVPVAAILDANGLESETLQIGEALFLPGVAMDPTQFLLAIGELFHWPARGRFTSGYGMRVHPITGVWHMHTGIDVANVTGTPITAAQRGRVVYTDEFNVAYGKMVIIDHGLGFRTLYGHFDSIRVSVGQYVETGQIIGLMGNTGRSTGSHLHFSVIRNGIWEDPLLHLP